MRVKQALVAANTPPRPVMPELGALEIRVVVDGATPTSSERFWDVIGCAGPHGEYPPDTGPIADLLNE